MPQIVFDKIEFIVMLISQFAQRYGMTEAEAYRYLKTYDALRLCEKHYGAMHTLSLADNLDALQTYCKRKGGRL